MKFLGNFLIIFIACGSLCAQYLTPLEFEDFEPLWSHYSFVPGLDDSQQGFTSRIDKEIIYFDGDVVLLQNINNNLEFQGYLTERIELNSGLLKWQHHKYFEEKGNREIAQLAYFDNDQLVLPLYKEIEDSNNLFFLNGYRSEIRIDKETGQTIDSLVTDQTDSLNKIIQIPSNLFIPSFSSYIFPLNDSNVSYIKNEIDTLNTLFKQFTLDDKGHLLETNSIEISVPYASQKAQVYKVNNDQNLLFITGIKSDSVGIAEESYCYVGMASTDNISIGSRDISSELSSNISSYNIEWVGSDCFIIRTVTVEFSDPNQNEINYIILDYDLNILNRFNLSASEWILNKGSFKLGFIDKNQIVLCGLEVFDGRHNLNFYTNDANNDIILSRSITVKSEDQELFLFNYSITPEGKSLVHLNQKNTTLPLPVLPNWSLWLLMDSQELGIISNTVNTVSSKVEVFPNPTTGVLTIKDINPSSKINIYNTNGRLLTHLTSISNKIDISYLPSGAYILEIENIRNAKRFKIIKI